MVNDRYPLEESYSTADMFHYVNKDHLSYISAYYQVEHYCQMDTVY